jgi:hypothetical protein
VVAGHREVAATQVFRRRVLDEVVAFFGNLHASLRPTLQTCTSYDLVVFMQEGWLTRHTGAHYSAFYQRNVPCGEYVRKCLGALKGVLKQLGRDGTWQDAGEVGNPMASEVVRRWYTGYTQLLFDEGYVEGRAVPLTEKGMRMVVDRLAEEAVGAGDGTVQRAMLLRDLCCIMYLWVGAQRGAECGELLVTDFRVPGAGGRGAWPSIEAGELHAGAGIVVEPSRGTKKRQHAHPGEVQVQVEEAAGASYCLVRWLRVYAAAMQACDHVVQSWVFRPVMVGSHAGFQNKPMSSQTMNAAYQRHVRACEFFQGESLHGIRRGKFQHNRYVLGMSRQEIADSALVGDVSNIDRYTHQTTHFPRQERAAGKEAKRARRGSGPGGS